MIGAYIIILVMMKKHICESMWRKGKGRTETKANEKYPIDSPTKSTDFME